MANGSNIRHNGVEDVSKVSFDGLLGMLQKEHEREVSSVRQNLERQYKAMQEELLKRHGLLDNFEMRSAAKLQDGQDTQLAVMCENDNNTEKPSGPHAFLMTSPSERQALNTLEGTLEDVNDDLQRISRWSACHQTPRRHAIVHSWRQRIFSFVHWQSFECLCILAIFSNGVLMGLEMDYIARYEIDPNAPPMSYLVTSQLYTLWFMIELLLRIFAHGSNFFCGFDWRWNVFDLLVVGTDTSQSVMDLLASAGDMRLSNLTFLRLLRILRITRALRIIRALRFFSDLRIMVGSLTKAGTPLMWTMAVFFLIIYVFSYFLLSTIAFHTYEQPEDKYYSNYRQYWSDLPTAMLTLYSCMSGGVSWMEVGYPILHIGWPYAVVLIAFLFLMLFVVTNIVTGIFVDSAIQKAENDRDEIIQQETEAREEAMKNLKFLFQEFDDDQSGTLTVDELERHLRNAEVAALLESLGLQVNAARWLFRALDVHSTNAIKIEEFIFGCMRLRGPATSIDLATHRLESQRFQADVMNALKLVQEKHVHIQSAFEIVQQQHADFMINCITSREFKMSL